MCRKARPREGQRKRTRSASVTSPPPPRPTKLNFSKLKSVAKLIELSKVWPRHGFSWLLDEGLPWSARPSNPQWRRACLLRGVVSCKRSRRRAGLPYAFASRGLANLIRRSGGNRSPAYYGALELPGGSAAMMRMDRRISALCTGNQLNQTSRTCNTGSLNPSKG